MGRAEQGRGCPAAPDALAASTSDHVGGAVRGEPLKGSVVVDVDLRESAGDQLVAEVLAVGQPDVGEQSPVAVTGVLGRITSQDDPLSVGEPRRRGGRGVHVADAVLRSVDSITRTHAPCEHTFVTAQGSPLTRFRRAVERKSLLNAELAAREMGQLDLEDALSLVLLYAGADDPRFDRAATRWIARFCVEGKPSLSELQAAVCALLCSGGAGAVRRQVCSRRSRRTSGWSAAVAPAAEVSAASVSAADASATQDGHTSGLTLLRPRAHFSRALIRDLR